MVAGHNKCAIRLEFDASPICYSAMQKRHCLWWISCFIQYINIYVCFQFSRVTTILTTVIIIIGLLKRDETFAFNGSTSSIKSIREHFLRCFYITFHIYICIRLTCALYMRLRQHGICIYIIIIINVRLLGMFRQNKL